MTNSTLDTGPSNDDEKIPTTARAYGVALRNGCVLLVRASMTSNAPKLWWLPGGGIDWGESPEDALIREVHEETGLRASSPRLVHVTSDIRQRLNGTWVHTVRVVYAIDVSDEPLVSESTGTSDLAKWVPLSELDAFDVADYARRAIDAVYTK